MIFNESPKAFIGPNDEESKEDLVFFSRFDSIIRLMSTVNKTPIP